MTLEQVAHGVFGVPRIPDLLPAPRTFDMLISAPSRLRPLFNARDKAFISAHWPAKQFCGALSSAF